MQIRHRSTKAAVRNPDAMPLIEAAKILRAVEVGSPRNVLELHVKCKLERGAPPIRGKVVLPRDVRLKSVKVLVLADGQQAVAARAAGADIVGAEDLIPKINDESIKYDKCIATPALFPLLAPLARQLGPKGLMPSPKRGTVTDDITAAVQDAKGLFEFRTDKQGVVHTGVARLGFSMDEITENATVVLNEIKDLGRNAEGKKKGASGNIIENIYLSSTHGPGIPIDLASV